MKISDKFREYLNDKVVTVNYEFSEYDVYFGNLWIDSYGTEKDAKNHAKDLKKELIRIIEEY